MSDPPSVNSCSTGPATRNPDAAYRELRSAPRDNPVNYCRWLQRDTPLLIEAMGWGKICATGGDNELISNATLKDPQDRR
jgi:hypothetical protein